MMTHSHISQKDLLHTVPPESIHQSGRGKTRGFAIQLNAIKRWTCLRPTAMAPCLCRGRFAAKLRRKMGQYFLAVLYKVMKKETTDTTLN